MKYYIKLLRPQHYIKNLLIFLPIIFSKNFFNFELIKNTLLGVIIFSLASSFVYIVNDIIDVEYDKKHEVKKLRPIAYGKVSIKNACILACILLIVSTILNSVFSSVWAYVILYGYIIMNILYSIKLKHIPILDISILALGFILRILYGSVITGIEISNWLYLTILSFSFYMGLGKRRNELINSNSDTRKVLDFYNQSFLSSNMYMCMTIGIIFYSLWCLNMQNSLNKYINIIYTIPLVIIICMKYSLDIEKNSSGDPVDVIIHDKVLIGLVFIYALIVFGIIYL